MGDALEALRWRDEILQILYWFRGEGLGEEVAARDLLPFLGSAAESVDQHLRRLADEGYVDTVGEFPVRYRLTCNGRPFALFRGATGSAPICVTGASEQPCQRAFLAEHLHRTL